MPQKKQPTINKFMDALVMVPGFAMTLDELKAHAAKIPRDSGVRPVNQREGIRAKTPYNYWCATKWKEHCETEYGRTLPLADLKYTTGENKGGVKVSAHTGERKEMWSDFKESCEFNSLQLEVDSENEKLGKISSKPKSTRAQGEEVIQHLKKEIAEARGEKFEDIAEIQRLEEIQRLNDEALAKAQSEKSDSDSDDGDSESDSESSPHKQWACSGKKSTEINCFKAWIMFNDPDSYGEGKKKAISRDEYRELKDVHNLDNFSGNNYTEDCPWFQFINSN